MNHPRLTYPFTFLVEANTVRLIAGEDFRYTLSAPGIERWLPDWLKHLDGSRSVEQCLDLLNVEHRPAARKLIEQLASERVLADGPAIVNHAPRTGYSIAGNAAWISSLGTDEPGEILVYCQDRLDYAAVLQFQRAHRHRPWVWVTTAPMTRAYLGPLFLPDAGPCFNCLLNHFRRLSPVPSLYPDLAAHALQGGEIPASPFPEPAIPVLISLLKWKLELASRPEGVAALYRLHVLEVSDLTVSSHRVYIDPECSECR